MPEGKEGGAAFSARRPPRFWRLREREAELRRKLVARYEEEGS
jgi:naphthoate synthase/2-ketocyclohexanecarboxyl-CoA hydrolase